MLNSYLGMDRYIFEGMGLSNFLGKTERAGTRAKNKIGKGYRLRYVEISW